jgi:NAD(P) transhydrogenase subunit alpha
MIIGIAKESFAGEGRVALVPDTAGVLSAAGFEVLVEPGAGVGAGFPDAAYQAKGAKLAPDRAGVFDADVILQVRTLGANEINGRADLGMMRCGQVFIGMAEPLTALTEAKALADAGVSLFALELMPRITRAQSMDVLSSMATLAGYKAVLLAASQLPGIFPLLMTAAGTLAPARVLILGVGVAGLQAIATARRLGAVVEAYDVRPAVKEQVESLGAKFVDLGLETADSEDAGGYAKAQGEEFYQRQRQAMGNVIAANDVVITTAVIPGKKAPILVTGEMVAGMPPGSVIVDLAAERGGNCACTQPGQTVDVGGVSVIGPLNLPSTVARHASQMYAQNISTFFQYLCKENRITFDREDEIVRETLVVHQGEVVHDALREQLNSNNSTSQGESS